MGANTMTKKQVYTVKEVAKLLRVTPRTIYNMIDDGQLQAFKVRDEYRIRRQALEAIMGQDIPDEEEEEKEGE